MKNKTHNSILQKKNKITLKFNRFHSSLPDMIDQKESDAVDTQKNMVKQLQ